MNADWRYVLKKYISKNEMENKILLEQKYIYSQAANRDSFFLLTLRKYLIEKLLPRQVVEIY